MKDGRGEGNVTTDFEDGRGATRKGMKQSAEAGKGKEDWTSPRTF